MTRKRSAASRDDPASRASGRRGTRESRCLSRSNAGPSSRSRIATAAATWSNCDSSVAPSPYTARSSFLSLPRGVRGARRAQTSSALEKSQASAEQAEQRGRSGKDALLVGITKDQGLDPLIAEGRAKGLPGKVSEARDEAAEPDATLDGE